MESCPRGHDPSEYRVDKRGWRVCRACHREWKRERYYVPKERPTTYKRRDRLELFMRHVEVTPDHWLWTGARVRDREDGNEYGRFQLESYEPSIGAHRAAWELMVGPIPTGMTVDHVCLVTLCVNPAHLGLETKQRNNELAGERRATCRNGHPRIPAFVKVTTTKEGWTLRRCLVCAGRKDAVALWESGEFDTE